MTDGILMVSVKWNDLRLQIIYHVQMLTLLQGFPFLKSSLPGWVRFGAPASSMPSQLIAN